jgi:hypothetical protein
VTTNELKQLKKSLPYGWIDKLIKKTGYSKSMISKTLNKERDNDEIILAAIEMAKENKNTKKKISQKIAQL